MFTSLYAINLRTGEQKQFSFPGKNELDEDPLVVGPYLTWFRKMIEQTKGDMGKKHSKWSRAYMA